MDRGSLGAIIGAKWANIKRIAQDAGCTSFEVDQGNFAITFTGSHEAVRQAARRRGLPDGSAAAACSRVGQTFVTRVWVPHAAPAGSDIKCGRPHPSHRRQLPAEERPAGAQAFQCFSRLLGRRRRGLLARCGGRQGAAAVSRSAFILVASQSHLARRTWSQLDSFCAAVHPGPVTSRA